MSMPLLPPGALLAVRRAHLDGHRRAIIARSIAAVLAGAVPVPFLDDWLVYTIQSSTLRKLADDHHVDLDEDAVRNLVHGESEPPSLGKLVVDTVGLRLLAKTWGKLLITYATTRRMQAVARHFTQMTLFDHYCARMHVGLGLDGKTALALRTTIDEAIATTPGGLSRRMLRLAVVATAKASVRAPFELVDIASRGAVRRLLARRREDGDGIELAVAEAVDTALEQQLARAESFLARVSTAVESHLSAQGNPYLDAVIDTFERLWRERRESQR